MPLVLGLLLALGAFPSADVTRPNLLLLILDDVGVDSIAAYGAHPNPPRTPTLDALAAAGVVYSRAFSQPTCSPTRAALLTGRNGWRTGIGTGIPFDFVPAGSGGPFGLKLGQRTLPEVLRRQGYRCAAVGKWHLANASTGSWSNPVLQGFEHHWGPIDNVGYWGWKRNAADASGAAQTTVDEYVTRVNVDDALATVAGFGDARWFAWVSFTAAHAPLHEPPHDLLSAETVAALAAAPDDHALKQRAMVEALDTEIGRLLEGIAPAVLARTTVVVIGDNGTVDAALTEPWAHSGAKGALLDGGIHVPLVVAGAGVVAPGRVCDALVADVDVFATLTELGGATLGGHVIDGLSFADTLGDPAAPGARRVVLAESFLPNGKQADKTKLKRAVRSASHKLIEISAPASNAGLRFFDLVADPLEEHNLVAPDAPPLEPADQAVFDSLRAELDAIALQAGF